MLSHSYRLRRGSRHFLSLPLNVDRITQQTINGLALLSRKTGKMQEQNVLRRIEKFNLKLLKNARSEFYRVFN